MSRQLLIIPFLLFSFTLLAQRETHLVRFTDKADSPFSLNRPEEFLSPRAIARRVRQGIAFTERDLPVNPRYVEQVRQTGAEVRYTTRWMNGVIIDASGTTLNDVLALPFVAEGGQISFEFFPQTKDFSNLAEVTQTEDEDYGDALEQSRMLGLDAMNDAGYRGEGIRVAVMDAGFGRVPDMTAFSELNLGGTYDFVSDETDVFDGGSHGQRVLSAMAAYKPNELVGAAYEAEYFLFTTEDERSESRAEEAYWLVAAERADSLGVDVIVSSLGYRDFDNPDYNYQVEDLTGDDALITRAADWAAAAGMLVVTSAGNSGNSSWRRLTFPADADSILSVGAVDGFGNPVGFSSEGFVEEGRVKPDVAALGLATAVWAPSDQVTFSSGTSFAAPLIATLAVGLWQANPDKTNMDVIASVQRSGDRYFDPTIKVGYGIPNFERANNYLVLSTEEAELESVSVFPNPVENGEVAIRFGDQHLAKVFTVQLYDLQGRSLAQPQRLIPQTNELRYALPWQRSAGMMILRVQGEDGQAHFRLVTP